MLRQRLFLPAFLAFLLGVVLFVVIASDAARHTTLLVVAALGILVTSHVLRRELRERWVYQRRDGEEPGAGTRRVMRTGVVEADMLEPSELRRLREIEHQLRTDDPEFAARIGARSGVRRDSGGHGS
jgi:hypothetical protein